MNDTSQQTDLSQLLLSIMERIGEFMQAERTTLFLYDRECDELWSKVASVAEVDEIRLPAGIGIAGHVMNTGETINIPDAYADSRFNPEVDRKSGFHTRNILCQPIVNYQQQRIGVVQVLNKHSGTFNQQDEKLLEALSSQSAIAIENSQLYENVSKLHAKEIALSQALEQKHRELQQAYLSIEEKNTKLRSRLSNRRLIQRFVVAALLVISLSLGGWWFFGQADYATLRTQFITSFSTESDTARRNSESGNSQIIEIETQAVDDWLRLSGKVQPISWVELSSPLDASIQALHFRFGDTVEAGQLLISLDTRDQQRQLREANGRLIEAEQAMTKLRNWNNSLEVIRARRDVTRAQEQLARSQRLTQETQRMFDKGIVSANELEDNKASVVEQQRSLVSARESLQEVLASGGASQKRIARLNLQNAREDVEALQASLAQAEIRSPTAGTIFPSLTNAPKKMQDTLRVGLKLSGNTALLAIADFSGIAIESSVPEAKLLSLKPRQTARVRIPALDGVTLEGYIAFIAGRASAQEGRRNRNNASSFKVEVAVPDINAAQRQALRIGMSANARVKIYDNPAAVVVPFEALIVEEDDYAVQVVNADGSQERRDVEIRSTLVDGVEIAEGLTAGERVVLQN